ncbi:MAG: hypothetical protein ACRETQ_05010 [Gammaproteobacteria bacterium]
MKRLLVLLGVIILGGAGWSLGKHAGLVTAWLLSGVGSIIGAYIGWRISRAYLD